MPFSYDMSKNNAVRHGKGRTYTPKSHRDYRDALVLLLKGALQGVSLREGKVWLSIFVEKPDNRGDAINVLDFVADATKEATRVDDRWYSIAGLDWTIKKDNPQLYVRIGQEE